MSTPEKIVEALLGDEEDPKDFAHAMPQAQPFTVSSSWGEIECDATTGMIISRQIAGESDFEDPEDPNTEVDPDAAWMLNIERFDMDEYHAWIRKNFGQDLESQTGCDILFIGWWNKDGSYEPAEEDARADYVADRADDQPGDEQGPAGFVQPPIDPHAGGHERG